MNKNISPIKYPSLLLPKQIVSPFKKFTPRNGNINQQSNLCSQSPSPANEPMPFTNKNLNAETKAACSRIRKLSYNQVSISSICPIISTRKSEMRTNDQNEISHDIYNPRSRKLNNQTNTMTHRSQFLHKNNNSDLQNHNLASQQQHKVNQSYQPNQNDLMKKKLYDGHMFEDKTINNFYSLKSIPVDPKSPFNSVKQTKFRKNSDDTGFQSKDGKTKLPSFLLKKIQKQSLSPQQQGINNLYKQQDVSSLCPDKKEKIFNLRDFKVLKQLGQGKFGKVLLVKQKATGFICAMKVFKKSQLKQDSFIEQFIRQLKIQCYLNHPNIIKMYGYFDDLSYIYVLLQVAFGGTLYQFLEGLQHEERLRKSGSGSTEDGHKRDGRRGLSLRQTAYIMYQLCSAIKHLHLNNIIHRDLKPENIVIHEKTIKLCDFGWSVFKGTQMRTTFCGTPLYLCPQLITGEQYDEKVDIWAIGIMLYQFLIGPNPFNIKEEADLANIIFQDVEINNMIGNHQPLDSTVIDLIRGCLNKDPLQRLDIKQIINHEFFKKYCPQLISSNNSISRHGSMSMSQTFKQPASSQIN